MSEAQAKSTQGVGGKVIVTRTSFLILTLVLLLCLSAVPMVPGAEATSATWETEGEMPVERTAFVSAELSDGRVFVAFGFNSSADQFCSDAYIVGPDDLSWTRLADPPVRTLYSTGACIGDVVYIFGGIFDNYTYVDTVLTYDVWTGEWGVGPNAPFGGSYLRSAAIDDHRIMIVGIGTGRDGCYIYDKNEMSFTAASYLPDGRLCGALVKHGDYLLYFGGSDDTNTVRDEVFKYDVDDDYWWTASNMPEPRTAMSAVKASDGLVYLLGGNDVHTWYGASIADCMAYDELNGRFIDIPDLPEATQYSAAFELSDGRLVCFGGHDGMAGPLSVNTLRIWSVEASISSDTVGQGESVWLSITVNTNYAMMDGLYGTVFLTAMGVTYATYDFYAMGDMAYVEIPISEGAMPLGYVLVLEDVGYNYQQDFQFEEFPLTVTEAPSIDDRMDQLQDELNETRAELREAVDAKLDAMIGYVILIVVIITLLVAVVSLLRKK